MFCVECGTKIVGGASFCSVCGRPVESMKEDGNTTYLQNELREIEHKIAEVKKYVLMQREAHESRMIEMQKQIALEEERIHNLLSEKEALEMHYAEEKTVITDPDQMAQLITYCPNCNNYVGEGNFCGKCGNKIR